MNENNGLGWVTAAISAAVSITGALISRAKAKKAAKKANEQSVKHESMTALYNAYQQQEYKRQQEQQEQVKTGIFAAVGVISVFLLLKSKKNKKR